MVFFCPTARYCLGNCLAQVGNSFFVRGNKCDRAMDEEGNSWLGYETAD